MATSAAMDHETTTQDHDQHPTRRSSGRRKAKGGGEKKNKQPRRGMGVAKLEERLREQSEITLPFPEMNPSSAYHHHHLHSYGQAGPTWNPAGSPGLYGLMARSDRRLLQNHHQFGNDSNFVAKNSDGNVAKCYALHCNACHKKKKINGAARPDMYKCGDRRFLGLDFGDNQNFLNQDNLGGGKPYGSNKVEVVAVHRKGSSDGGNHGVLMEYDFFPSTAKNDGGELVGHLGNSLDASNCVDLSLKLSY